MWAILPSLVAYQLIAFGGVLDYSKNVVFVAVLSVSVVLLIAQIIRRKSINATFVFLVLVCPVGALFDANVGTATMTGILAWHFTRNQPYRGLSILKAMTVLGVIEAILGLIQYFLSPGWILGYHNSTNAMSGTFINKNHFAGFIGLVVPACLALGWRSRNKGSDAGHTSIYVMAAMIMVVSVVFSLSRLGLFSVVAGVVITLAVLRSLNKESRTRWLIMIPAGLTLSLTLWIGIDAIVMNYAQLLRQDAIVQEGRLLVYKDTVKLLREYPLGLWTASYADMFRRYQTFRPDLLFDHVHNDYLEMLVKFGIPVGSLFWGIVFWIFFRSMKALHDRKTIEDQTILVGGIGSVSAMLIHSFGDFNLQIPVNAVLFAMNIGMLAAISAAQPYPRYSRM